MKNNLLTHLRRGARFSRLTLLAIMLITLALPAARPAFAASLTVNSIGDESDATPGNGACLTSLGECTLRAAIQEANALAGGDTISFNIPGTGVHKIALASALPPLTTPITIDGLTQPGASCAAWPPTLQIELDGTGLPSSIGLELAFGSSGSTARGLVIHDFIIGIELANSSSNIIECNFLGTDPAGTQARGNSIAGVYLQQFSINNQIGGPAVSQRNLISGNGQDQVSLNNFGSAPDFNTIQNNYIGTDAAGSAGLGGGSFGAVWLFGSSNITIQGNLIAGNSGNGITISGDAGRPSGNTTIQGNLIGTNAAGTAVIGNSGSGITLGTNGNENVSGATIGSDINGVNDATEANIIAGNAGNGVQIYGNAGFASIRGNQIYGNGGLGTDLGEDGLSLNHVGNFASGANRFQNFPVLTQAISSGSRTRVVGTLTSAPGANFDIDIYTNPTCDPSSFGEGQTYLGSFTIGTTDAGVATFDQILNGGVSEPAGISATATGPSGTSEFSYCRPVASPNLNWVQALEVPSGSTTQQYITDRFQEKWFKFPVQPGAKVRVTLTGLPGSAVSLHNDPLPFYNGLTNPQSAAVLSAEAADSAFLPTGSLPFGSLPFGSLPFGSLPFGSLPFGSLDSGFLPFGSLPFGSLPFGSLPFGSLPFGSLPFGSLPFGSLPTGSLPFGSLPFGSLPSGSLPFGSLPFGSLPFGSLPFGSLPSDSLPGGLLPFGSLPFGSLPFGSLDAYNGAARRSLVGIAMAPYATSQTIERDTYDTSGDLYVRVVGPYSLTAPFSLQINVAGGVCATVLPVPSSLPAVSGTLPSGTHKSLLLTDSSRLTGSAAEVAAALADLRALAARADVDGLVIDLADSATYPRVAWANQQADTVPTCPSAKNTVATEIRAVIDAYRSANSSGGATTLQYIVLGGGASVIPFRQVPDVAGLASEKEYVAPVAPQTPSEAGLRSGLVQGQDFYGSQTQISQGGNTIDLPGLAVGRLVDSAADISAAVQTYIATDGVVTPSSALVTGYDFVGDAAAAIKQETDAGTNSASDSLIQSPGLPPTDASAWTADQLRAQLLGQRHDIAVMSGHFSAGGLLAADYHTQLSAAEVADSTADLTNIIVLALGCHGGYSIPSSDLLDGASPNPDWAKAFLRKGAAGFVAATGYAYGDTDLTEYGERLFVTLTQQLRTGRNAVALGQALVAAKQQYLANTAQLTGIDAKTVVEMTLYGLPMMKVNMPGARLNAPADTSIVAGTTDLPADTGATPGLSSTAVVLSPAVTSNTKQLFNLNTGASVTTTYLSGRDGVVANPFEPIYPKQLYNISATDKVLRGVAFRGGDYTDESGIVPLTSAPGTETSTAHSAFTTDVFYPTQTWMPNFYDAIGGGATRLVAIPAQFQSSAPGAVDGTLRTFTSMDMQLYYLPADWTAPGSPADVKAAAVAAGPGILGASASSIGTTVTFKVNAKAEGAGGVQAVWVLYTSTAGGQYYGHWLPLDLTKSAEDPTLWTGTLNGVSNPASMRFMVQAVGGAGLTTLASNLGAYYQVGDTNLVTPSPIATTLALISPPSAGTYLKSSSFTVELRANGVGLAGQPVTIELLGQQAQGITGGDGRATISLRPVSSPGSYTINASFSGSASFKSATASSPFTLAQDTTTIALSPTSAAIAAGQPTPFVATLRDSSGQALAGKSIAFVVHNTAQTLVRTVIADYQGSAALGALALPDGSYTVDVYFGGTIPIGGGQTLALSDVGYASSRRLGASLTIAGAGDTTPPTITASATAAPNAAGWYNESVTVRFTCADAGSGIPVGGCPADQTLSAEGAAVSSTAQTVTDVAGNTSAPSNVVTVKIDKTAPTTSLSGTPAALTNSSAATFSFSGADVGGSGVSGFACSLDDATPAPCASPQSYSGLADGSHTFAVQATDAAGNSDANPAAFNWTVDTAEPETLIISAPAAASNSASASFEFGGTEEGSTLKCSLDGAALTACASPKGYTGLANGSHTFVVQATDAAGNSDSTPASFTWTIDTVTSITVIDSGPPALTSSTSATIAFHATKAGGSFACSLDGAPFAACTSPKIYTGLANGDHTFQVRATDSFGVTDPTPASYHWAVDTIAPDTTINSTPPALSNSSGATFTFDSSETGGSFSCSLDGAAYAACVSPQSLNGLADGPHTYRVRATDAAGNADATPASYSWTIDTAPPNTTIAGGPASPTSSASASFSLTSSEPGATFECSLDSAAFVACPSAPSYSGLADGNHIFQARATDAAGNTDPNAASFNWTIDTAAPVTTITSSPPATTRSTSASFSFSATKAGSTFECRLDGAAFAACTSPKSYTGLAAGSHTFQVRSRDPLGNLDPSPASYSWTIDLTPPNTAISASPANPTTSTAASFSFTSTEVGGSFECKLDSAAFAACASPKSYTGLALGTHSFQVRALDAAGNVDPTPASYSWTIKALYAFDGFYRPVANLPAVNRAKAGSLIPVRFSLGGNFGADIFAPGYPQSQLVACSPAPTTEIDVDETETPSFDFLIYNPITKRYIYLWKTERSWAGTCRQLLVKFNDGSPTKVVNFRFVR